MNRWKSFWCSEEMWMWTLDVLYVAQGTPVQLHSPAHGSEHGKIPQTSLGVSWMEPRKLGVFVWAWPVGSRPDRGPPPCLCCFDLNSWTWAHTHIRTPIHSRLKSLTHICLSLYPPPFFFLFLFPSWVLSSFHSLTHSLFSHQVGLVSLWWNRSSCLPVVLPPLKLRTSLRAEHQTLCGVSNRFTSSRPCAIAPSQKGRQQSRCTVLFYSPLF